MKISEWWENEDPGEKSKILSLRLNSHLYDMLQGETKSANKTPSEFVRDLIYDELIPDAYLLFIRDQLGRLPELSPIDKDNGITKIKRYFKELEFLLEIIDESIKDYEEKMTYLKEKRSRIVGGIGELPNLIGEFPEEVEESRERKRMLGKNDTKTNQNDGIN